MITATHTCHTANCTTDVPAVLEKEGLCLSHYMEEGFKKLAAAQDAVHGGRKVDRQTTEWLLAQVDFAVELLAQEGAKWDADQRSSLLELLLGVANLHEHARQSAVPARR